jgi:hypothetical protein
MEVKPKTHGDLRELVANAIHDVRYGHLDREVLYSMAEGLSAVNSSMRTEISAWALMVKAGEAPNHELGSLPINKLDKKG